VLAEDPPAEIVNLLNRRIRALERGDFAAQPVGLRTEVGCERGWLGKGRRWLVGRGSVEEEHQYDQGGPGQEQNVRAPLLGWRVDGVNGGFPIQEWDYEWYID
jgi:hypothetical protein